MPPSSDQQRVSGLKAQASAVLPSARQLAEQTMDGVPPAQASDYSGNRLDPERAKELYDRFYRMRMRGIENVALMSRTLGVTRKTVYAWRDRFDTEMRRQESDRTQIVERNKLVGKVSEIQQALWGIYASESATPNVKVSALNVALHSVAQEAELLGLRRAPFIQQDGPFAMRAEDYDLDEVRDLGEMARKMQMVLQGGDVTPPEGYVDQTDDVYRP